MDDKQREQAKLRKQRQRDKERDISVTSDSVTGQSVTKSGRDKGSVTLLSRPNGADYDPNETLLDGRLRYLMLSDGQVLDRMTVDRPCPGNVGPESGQHPFYGMNSVIFTPKQRSKGTLVETLIGPAGRNKLEHIVSALDKPIQLGGTVMGGKLSDHVRYGINGPTFTIVKELLDATS